MPQLVWMHIVDDIAVVLDVGIMIQAFVFVTRTSIQTRIYAFVHDFFLQPFVTYRQPDICMYPGLSKQVHTYRVSKLK